LCSYPEAAELIVFLAKLKPQNGCIMKNIRLEYFFLSVLMIAAVVSCKKDDGKNIGGGNLPTTYIKILDSSFDPFAVTKVSGQSFTFLNNTTNVHQLMSDDSTEIVSGPIAPGASFVVTPDTAALEDIIINYHCVQHPSARGTITLTP
jgi:hypothetical protein